jgi:hypothetical protein
MSFKVGEIAIANFPGVWTYGKEALIVRIVTSGKRRSDPGPPRTGLRYEVEIDGSSDSRFYEGKKLQYFADELRKRPDDKPFSSWYREHIITDPIAVPNLEKTMKHVQSNLQTYTEGRGNG